MQTYHGIETRPLREDEVRFTIEADFDYLPIRGNAIASDDEELDRIVEDEVIDRLERGDVWAWALVKVTATWEDEGVVHEASDYLGACSFWDESDFKAVYYEDMKAQALANLNADIAAHARALAKLQTVFTV